MLTFEQVVTKYSATALRPPIVLEIDRQWAMLQRPPWLPRSLVNGRCGFAAGNMQLTWSEVIADLAAKFESHYNGQAKTYDEWSHLWRMKWVPELNARKLFPEFAPKQPMHPFFRFGSSGFERALAVASQDEERMWRRFGVAQFTPDDPRLAYVEGDDLVSTKERILRFAAHRFPDGIVCLTTALFVHDLTERCGPDIWMWGHQPPEDTTGLRLFTASAKVFATGHAPYLLRGSDIRVRVTSPARSIVDCFSWHQLAGLKIAEAALLKAIRQRLVTADEISRIANRRDVAAPLVASALKRLKQSH
ncbi:type IV toxin-antitoxin system AbiEi family antitoxin domain-containing protein [Hyphomicrobium sulfonivorans]|uniref:type IV toxin-antitoxin system AbiEi family antitoxin domain-containing protein n=1 Tax=Hyphomicrobium sulfonivorans TaxID=121290 RepID=UPI0015700C76|nr:hypothetical protein [Hyphomicrobium sulfonivorans]MBI1651154.1 hypothetical protein [Hyphomicrobium sulfonivorans]NSL72462.1 hypothetical protein [Hyphomicrobium sulfonivorans]